MICVQSLTAKHKSFSNDNIESFALFYGSNVEDLNPRATKGGGLERPPLGFSLRELVPYGI